MFLMHDTITMSYGVIFASKCGCQLKGWDRSLAGVHVVGLPVVLDGPEAIQLGHTVGRARVEGRLLALGHLVHLHGRILTSLLWDD